MEWQCDGQAAPGGPALASAPDGFCSAAATRDWRRLNLVLTTGGFPLLEEASFSAWNLVAFFPDCSSILALFRLFSSLSSCFCHLWWPGRPALSNFRSSDQI